MAVKETAGRKAPPAPKSGMTLNQRRTLVGLSFITPNFIGFLVLILIPVLFTFWLCFNRVANEARTDAAQRMGALMAQAV